MRPDEVQTIACQSGPLRLVWLANLRDRPAKVRLSNLKGQARTMMLGLGRAPRGRPLGFEISEPVELSGWHRSRCFRRGAHGIAGMSKMRDPSMPSRYSLSREMPQ